MSAPRLLVFLLVLSPAVVRGQVEERVLTGNLRFDLVASGGFVASGDSVFGASVLPPRKSPLRAAVYSAIVPGAGEFYAESYWRSGAFFVAEIALWVMYSLYESQGDRQTREFEQFADAHWSVVKYAQWMEQHALALNPDAGGCSGTVVNSDPNLPPWDRVDWARVNMCEELIGRRASTGFSHRLPRRPDQQYYEVIGKYAQYNAGWDDSNAVPSDYLTALSARFLFYRDMRGRANRLYTIASTAAYVLVANHVFSALDAALSASEFNRNVTMEAHVRPVMRGIGLVEFLPTASVTVTF